MNLRWMLLFALACSVVGLTSCGTTPGSASGPAPGSGLNGNWSLTGNLQAKQYPVITMSLAVNGDQIIGDGTFFPKCQPSSPALPSPLGGGMFFSGQIAADGTFHIVTGSLLAIPSALPVQVTLDGKMPAPGSTTWSGNYSIVSTPSSTTCNVSQQGSFTATAFPALNKTYTGTFGSAELGDLVSVSMQVTQGAPVTVQLADGSLYTRLPLSGTISIQGVPCFSQGTATSSALINQVDGGSIELIFNMNDGSQVQLSGWISDTTETTIDPVFFSTLDGNCKYDLSAVGTMTAQ